MCFFLKVENRSVEQLQSKYKDLKKGARQIVSKMKRSMSETGNKKLDADTVRVMNENSLLLSLRNQMGPSATGFHSQHCEYRYKQFEFYFVLLFVRKIFDYLVIII